MEGSFHENYNRRLDDAPGDPLQLHRLISEGEHQSLDFKFRVDSSQKIAKTLSAFANTEGGDLLIGVKDNGKITGIDPEEEFYMIEGAADIYCKPKVEFSTLVYEAEGLLVLRISVEASANRPHFAREADGLWKAYVRQEDENFAASKVLVRFLRDKNPTSKKKNLVAYGPIERALFDLLAEEEQISISKFSRKARIPLFKAEKTLALFLKWEIVEWRATDKGIRYSLKKEES